MPRSGVGIGRVSILPCCEGRCPNVQLYLSWDVTAQGSRRPRRSIGSQVEKRPAPTPKFPYRKFMKNDLASSQIEGSSSQTHLKILPFQPISHTISHPVGHLIQPSLETQRQHWVHQCPSFSTGEFPGNAKVMEVRVKHSERRCNRWLLRWQTFQVVISCLSPMTKYKSLISNRCKSLQICFWTSLS